MAKDKAPEVSIAQIVSQHQLMKKNVWSPNNSSDGGGQIHLTEV